MASVRFIQEIRSQEHGLKVLCISQNPSATRSADGNVATCSMISTALPNDKYGHVVMMNIFPFEATKTPELFPFLNCEKYARICIQNIVSIAHKVHECQFDVIIFAPGQDFCHQAHDRNLLNLFKQLIRNILDIIEPYPLYHWGCVCKNGIPSHPMGCHRKRKCLTLTPFTEAERNTMREKLKLDRL
jgi:hypothetical protein